MEPMCRDEGPSSHQEGLHAHGSWPENPVFLRLKH